MKKYIFPNLFFSLLFLCVVGITLMHAVSIAHAQMTQLGTMNIETYGSDLPYTVDCPNYSSLPIYATSSNQYDSTAGSGSGETHGGCLLGFTITTHDIVQPLCLDALNSHGGYITAINQVPLFTGPGTVNLSNYTNNLSPEQYGAGCTGVEVMASSNAPSNLTATMVMNTSQQGVKLTWKNNTTNTTAINVDRESTAVNSFNSIATLGSTTTSYFDDFSKSTNALALTSSREVYRVDAKLPNGTYTDYSNTATTSNCVLLSGTGNDKVIFMRGSMWNGSDADFLTVANNIISTGFQSIDPFKSFFTDFSFYLDLQSINEDNLSAGEPDPNGGLSPVGIPYLQHNDSIVPDIKGRSSCGPNNFEYIFLSGDPQEYSAYAFLGSGFVFIDLKTEEEWALNIALGSTTMPDESYPLGPTAIHESGHALGDLNDEYLYSTSSLLSEPNTVQNTNCTVAPDIYYKSSSDDLLYGSTTITGCNYLDVGIKGINYYAPSATSIMDWQYGDSGKFNVISCGYVLAAILGHSTYLNHFAHQYWPACMNLDTVDGIASGANAVPAAHPIPPPSPTAISPPDDGDAYDQGDPTILGTNFTPTGNSVQLTSTSNSSEVYEYNDLPSTSNGTMLTFSISTTTPPGTYSVRVGAFNSNWSAPLPTHIKVVKPSAGSQTLTPVNISTPPTSSTLSLPSVTSPNLSTISSITTISPSSVSSSQLSSIIITGNGFTPTDAIMFTPFGKASPVAGVVSSNNTATTISFPQNPQFTQVCTTVPCPSWTPQAGTYDISVVNSNTTTGSNSVLLTLTGVSIPPTLSTPTVAAPPVTTSVVSTVSAVQTSSVSAHATVTPPVSVSSVTAVPPVVSSVTAENHSQNPATAQGLIYVYWTAPPSNSGGSYTYTVSASPSYTKSVETTTGTGINMGCYPGGCFNGGGNFPGNGPYTFTVTATNKSGTITVGTSNAETVSPATSLSSPNGLTNLMASAWSSFVSLFVP